MKSATRVVGMLVVLVLAADLSAQTVTRFRAELDESFVILGGVQGTGSNATAVADFVLTQGPTETTMSYSIEFQNVDLDGNQTADILDNITALHLHDTTRCAPTFPQCIEGTDNAGTIHLLNIFGAPRNDDMDVMADPVNSIITGLWDDGDASPPGTMAPSLPISDPMVLDLLFNEQVALFVHTNEVPAAASGGYLTIVPEPTSLWLIAMALIPALRWFRS